jgi:hypothetical protein
VACRGNLLSLANNRQNMSHPGFSQRAFALLRPLLPGLLAPAALAPLVSEGVDGPARRASPSTPSLTKMTSRAAARKESGQQRSEDVQCSGGKSGMTHTSLCKKGVELYAHV